MPALAPYDPVLRYPEGKFYLTFFFSIGKVIIHIQLFPCIWVSLELVIQDTEKEKSLLLPTLKLSLLAHANKGGRVFSSPPPLLPSRGRTGTQEHLPPIYPAAYVAASNMHQQLKSCPAVPGAGGGQIWSQVKLSSKELEEHCACLHQEGLVVLQRGLLASAK